MKPAPFAYARPDTLDDVFGLLEKHGSEARILAGGQSLMATLNMRLSEPRILIDINRIEGLANISDAGSAIRIGAMARHVDVETSELVRTQVPLIASAMPHIAHPAIRNRGTFGGSIALADPAAELPACVTALDAEIVVAGRNGERRVSAGGFFKGLFETALEDGEIVTAIEIPKSGGDWKSGFMELARRHGDYAIIGLAAHVQIDGDRFGEARLAYFGAGDRPVAASRTAGLLRGRTLSDDLAADLAESLREELDPPDDFNADGAMRKHLAGVLAKRTLNAIMAD